MANTPGNIFVSLLKELNVKHTREFSDKFYREYPHKDNLYGLSRMLFKYGIDNIGIRVDNKEETLPLFEPPFIASAGNEFLIVVNNAGNAVEYIREEKKATVSPDNFLEMWSGVALIVETNENSIEPDYKQHRREYIARLIKKLFAVLSACILLGVSSYETFYFQPELILFLSINLLGLYTCYLLLLKQLHTHSRHADRICSLWAEGNDCNQVLKSGAARIFSFFSWSEAGLAYFGANVFIICLAPTLYSYAVLINLCTLPFTVWSVWYQKIVVRQWCPLCLLVQAILWLIFLCNFGLGLIGLPEFSWKGVFLTSSLFILFLFLTNIVLTYITTSRKNETSMLRINALKINESVFACLLKSGSRYNADRNGTGLLWGNVQAKNLITVVTNPHCNPCREVYKQLEEILNKTNNGFCIQYVLTSFNEILEESNKAWIATYLQKGAEGLRLLLADWYRNRSEFDKLHPYNDKDPNVQAELAKEKEWVAENNITSTPIILFNGYKLPDEYKLTDLMYFTDIDI